VIDPEQTPRGVGGLRMGGRGKIPQPDQGGSSRCNGYHLEKTKRRGGKGGFEHQKEGVHLKILKLDKTKPDELWYTLLSKEGGKTGLQGRGGDVRGGDSERGGKGGDSSKKNRYHGASGDRARGARTTEIQGGCGTTYLQHKTFLAMGAIMKSSTRNATAQGERRRRGESRKTRRPTLTPLVTTKGGIRDPI